ncbi:MAG: hypothetical protein P8P91_12940, partial [Pseudomonadales bacterium]|nr:hypothetical protein [Pseudomonadales bacterium]
IAGTIKDHNTGIAILNCHALDQARHLSAPFVDNTRATAALIGRPDKQYLEPSLRKNCQLCLRPSQSIIC